MNIVPSGAKKRMVAQTMMGDGDSFGDLETNVEIPEGVTSEIQPETPPQTEQIPEDGKPDLTEYIFKTLENFGYPPRRLEEYEKEFVNEKIFAGGVREVTIVIPDRYYGTRKRISNDDFNKMVNDIQKSFGLTFIDAERKDKKISINFSSQKQEEENEGVQLGDDLDEVYGQPKDKKTKRKVASIRDADDLYSLLLSRDSDLRKRIIGE